MSNLSRKKSATKAALNVANRAVAFDQAGQYEQAISSYTKAAEYLLKAADHESRKTETAELYSQATQYIQRAEQLKQQIKPPAPAPPLPQPTHPTPPSITPVFPPASFAAPPPTHTDGVASVATNCPATATVFTLPYEETVAVVAPSEENIYPSLAPVAVEAPVAVGVEELPRLNGWIRQLTMKSPRLWKKRYVTLAEGVLKYYKGEGGFPKGTIHLKGVRMKVLSEGSFKQQRKLKSMVDRFVVGAPSGLQLVTLDGLEILTLKPEYREQREMWTQAISNSIRILNP